MIWTIVKKELYENLCLLKFRILVILCVLSIVASNVVMLWDYHERQGDYSLNLPRHGETRVIIKPSMLSSYCAGLEKIIGRGYDINPKTFLMQPSATIVNPNFFSARFAVPDIAYIVKVLLSLVALLLTFDTLCGEKTRGTLRLVLSNAVPRTQVVLGKIVGNLIAVLVPFSLALLFGMLIIVLAGGVSISTEEVVRIMLFYGGSILYIAIFTLLGIAISAHTDAPGTSLVASLFAWTILVFGIPNVSGTIAQTISPIPSVQALEEEKLLTYALEYGLRAQGDETIGKTIHERLRHLENEYRNTLDRHVQIARRLSRISPSSSYVYFSSAITRNSLEDEHHLKRLILEYRNAIFEQPVRAGEIVFRDDRLSLSQSLRNVLTEVLMLVFFLIGLAVTAYLSFVRYDVR